MTERVWTSDDVAFVRRFPDKCCAEVIRRGNSEPCDLTAVAVAASTEEYDPDWWPVCRKHVRGRELVPLSTVLEALTTECHHRCRRRERRE